MTQRLWSPLLPRYSYPFTRVPQYSHRAANRRGAEEASSAPMVCFPCSPERLCCACDNRATLMGK